MVERFLSQTSFSSQEDFIKNLKINVPENFNFGYDVVDAWAAEQPDKNALLWTNDKGESRQFSFADMKRSTDMTASYFQSLGIGRGDMVMLILKRRYEFWYSTIALHKLGATVIPATHLLTKKDIIYRCNAADIKMIVAAGEGIILQHIKDALPECPTVEKLVSVGPEIPEGFEDFHQGIENAAPFVRPRHANTNDDISLMYFTSGTTGEPKMVAHDFTYPLGHIVTGSFWHNLDENSLHLTIADTGWGKAVWGKLYGQWIAGANIFVYDHEKFTPAAILEKIQEYHVTSLCAPPTIFRFLIHEDLTKFDLSSLKYCTIAGEALNPAVFETFKKLTGLMGRWQTLRSKPTVICDTGHNVGGWEHLAEHLKVLRQYCGQIYMIVGMVNDKDIDGVLSLMPQDAFYFFTQASVERAMPVEDFAVKAMRHGLSGTLCDTVQDAVEKALRRARENDLIFIGGSTFIVADALPLFMKEDEYK